MHLLCRQGCARQTSVAGGAGASTGVSAVTCLLSGSLDQRTAAAAPCGATRLERAALANLVAPRRSSEFDDRPVQGGKPAKVTGFRRATTPATHLNMGAMASTPKTIFKQPFMTGVNDGPPMTPAALAAFLDKLFKADLLALFTDQVKKYKTSSGKLDHPLDPDAAREEERHREHSGRGEREGSDRPEPESSDARFAVWRRAVLLRRRPHRDVLRAAWRVLVGERFRVHFRWSAHQDAHLCTS